MRLCKLINRESNILVLDEPTNHLDLESIQALNNGLVDYKGTILFDSHDHQFVETIANRIIEILPGGIIDRRETYDEFIKNEGLIEVREKLK